MTVTIEPQPREFVRRQRPPVRRQLRETIPAIERGEILREPLAVERDDLIVPKGYGLGVEIDERVTEKYPFIPGPWSYFRLDSPPETVAMTGDHSLKWVEAEHKV